MGFGRIFIIIFVFALLEVMVLARVADSIGWMVTILLTVFTAMLGSFLFRWQGLETWVRLNQRMAQGEMPGTEMVEGVMLLLGGALLITPGFITDGIGFLLLLPQSRKMMANSLIKQGVMQSFSSRQTAQGSAWFYQQTGGSQGPFTHPKNEPHTPQAYDDGKGHLIIEGEAEEKESK